MFILESGISNHVILHNKKYSYFAGNNYLGLAHNPAIKDAAIASIKKYGLNFSASRETTGTSELHIELEKLLSQFKNKEDTAVYASGYLGNRILLHSLRKKYTTIFTDESAHPSILDGVASDIPINFYNHLNYDHLENLLNKIDSQKPLIITDGIFALTGEIAHLDKINAIAQKYNAIIIVDDAHATGVLGENGRGTPEHFKLEQTKNIFQTETMSKALGNYGGFISSSQAIINEIRENSSAYVGSTALPPSVTAAGCASIKILLKHSDIRLQLLEKAQFIRNEIIEMDYNTTSDNTAIIPIFFNSQQKAKKFSEYLFENYIIAPYIDYPVKMDKYLVRMTVSAIHADDQIENLLKHLKTWRDKNGIN